VLSDVGDVGQAVAAVAAVFALAYAGRQLYLTNAIARRQTVSGFMERLNDPAVIPIIANARDYWAAVPVDATPEQKKAALDRFFGLPRETRQRLLFHLNVFEELGTLYRLGMVDRRAIEALLEPTSRHYWLEASWFIDYYRVENGNDIYEFWKAMNADLETQPRRFWIGPRRRPLGTYDRARAAQRIARSGR
jgi:hypothetical protein